MNWLTSSHQPRRHNPRIIRLMQSIPTPFAIHTHVPHRFDTTLITYFPIFFFFLHWLLPWRQHRALLTWGPDFEIRHLWHRQVVEHTVKIWVTGSSCVETKKEIVGSRLGNGTSRTATWKFGPSSITHPTLQVLGISDDGVWVIWNLKKCGLLKDTYDSNWTWILNFQVDLKSK